MYLFSVVTNPIAARITDIVFKYQQQFCLLFHEHIELRDPHHKRHTLTKMLPFTKPSVAFQSAHTFICLRCILSSSTLNRRINKILRIYPRNICNPSSADPQQSPTHIPVVNLISRLYVQTSLYTSSIKSTNQTRLIDIHSLDLPT